jgi:Phosphoribosyl-ATP pyrophosphohydrolase.
MTHPIEDIARFMKLGGQAVPDNIDREITTKELCDFLDRIQEEVDETFEAFGNRGPDFEEINKAFGLPESTLIHHDFAEVLDGFIDTAYVALTGAIRIAGAAKAAQAWDAVVDANLSKVDGRFGPPILNQFTGKIEKPEGWVAPDIEGIINA